LKIFSFNNQYQETGAQGRTKNHKKCNLKGTVNHINNTKASTSARSCTATVPQVQAKNSLQNSRPPFLDSNTVDYNLL